MALLLEILSWIAYETALLLLLSRQDLGFSEGSACYKPALGPRGLVPILGTKQDSGLSARDQATLLLLLSSTCINDSRLENLVMFLTSWLRSPTFFLSYLGHTDQWRSDIRNILVTRGLTDLDLTWDTDLGIDRNPIFKLRPYPTVNYPMLRLKL